MRVSHPGLRRGCVGAGVGWGRGDQSGTGLLLLQPHPMPPAASTAPLSSWLCICIGSGTVLYGTILYFIVELYFPSVVIRSSACLVMYYTVLLNTAELAVAARQ